MKDVLTNILMGFAILSLLSALALGFVWLCVQTKGILLIVAALLPLCWIAGREFRSAREYLRGPDL